MFPSVCVERVSELPDGQLASVELRPDGIIVYSVHKDHITAEGAEVLQILLNTARGAYHEAWHLPEVPASVFAH